MTFRTVVCSDREASMASMATSVTACAEQEETESGELSVSNQENLIFLIEKFPWLYDTRRADYQEGAWWENAWTTNAHKMGKTQLFKSIPFTNLHRLRVLKVVICTVRFVFLAA